MKKYCFLIISLLFTFNVYGQTYEELVNKAMDFIEANDYINAESALKDAIRKDPDNDGNILLFTNLGTVQRKLNKPQEALTSYNTVVKKLPNTIFALKNRAALFCELDSLSAAKRDYSLILSLDKENTDALYSRGLIYLTEKNYLAAEIDFNQILNIKPDDVYALNSLALLSKSKGDWTDAEERFTDLIYKYKNQPLFYINRAECYLQLKKLARAKNDLDKAKQLGYNDSWFYVLRGQFNLEQFDKYSAKQDFLKAQELGADPKVIKNFLLLCK